jgi:uncharacterized membrane protein YeaQ/YmgE (transglycosylase-associated protein family)
MPVGYSRQASASCGRPQQAHPLPTTRAAGQTPARVARHFPGEVNMSLLVTIIVGIIAGFLAGKIMKGSGYGILMDLVLGLIGGVIGGFVLGLVGLGNGGIIWSIIVATIGAVILVWLVRLIRGNRTTV